MCCYRWVGGRGDKGGERRGGKKPPHIKILKKETNKQAKKQTTKPRESPGMKAYGNLPAAYR